MKEKKEKKEIPVIQCPPGKAYGYDPGYTVKVKDML